MSILQLFFLFMLPYYNTAYELSCPPSSHWRFRAEGLCTIGLASQYYCLWDTNNKSYTESCSEKSDVAPKGRKYIVEGSPTFVPCSLVRYQPKTFYRNSSSHCILLKSLCAEKGQALSGQGSAEDDVRCRCDYKQRYDYVMRPNDICHCNPTQEDCSCYLKQCKDNEYLSPDYQCLLKDSFPVEYQCGQINVSREENTTVLSKDILTDSAMRTTTNGQTGGIVLIVIIALFIGFARIICHRFRDQVICNGISLERQITGNWRALKETINHDLMLKSLVKEGMIQTDRKNDFKMKSPNSQKNHYLMCLIRKSRDPSSVNKCIGILRMQGKSTIQVLNKSVINQNWRKRNLEKCRHQLTICAESLHEFFNPERVVDHFFEHFIFDVKDFEDVLTCEDSRTMTQCFMQKVETSLHKGSFECLLKVLKDYKYDIVLEELKTGLVPAISCNCEDAIIYSNCKVPEDNYEVNLTLSSANLNEEIEFEFWDSSCDCLVWLVKTFAVYPITSFVSGSATFRPLSDTTLKSLKEGSQSGCWSYLLETLFNIDYFRNSVENGIDIFEMNISVKGVCIDGERDKLQGQNQKEDDSVNIFTANKTFLESHIDVNELIRAFKKQEQSIFQDCDDIPEIDQKAEMFVGLLGRNIHLKSKFIRILKKQREKNKNILDRLHTFQKVFNSNADNLPNNIMYYFPDLVCIADDFETFRNNFVERNILCTELDSIQEQRHENNRHKMVAFLIEILKSDRRNTMLSLVDSLFMNKHDLLAERLLQRKEHSVEMSDSTFITESACRKDGLLFSSKFKVCYVD
ncbi:unnamed protein product [Mytilus coruscus]|uniref:DZIP3-like HEPN domain-containing protein n=1 Tax=Mytilus coruscus TaxID=42192 RepID=A0A6J8EV61_MYTCO|nr:unnamed protein product [Mytilus coruscus]